MSNSPLLHLGTRGSPLALAQAHETRRLLTEAHPELAGAIKIVTIQTTGDLIQDRALSAIGGKGLFTKEIEDRLLDGSIDLAVHSMKDVPTVLPEGLEISAVLQREDPRDAFFSNSAPSLATLPAGARVGSASLRRQAQIKALRPDLEVVTFRGSVQTRLRKLAEGQVAATLLALAGLNRLGQRDLVTAVLETDDMLPAPAQGAIGLEMHKNNDRVRGLVAAIHHNLTARRISAERSCLAELDGSCRTPIAALATVEGDRLYLKSLLASPDGCQIFRAERHGSINDAVSMGQDAGRALKADAGSDFFKMIQV